MRIAIISDVHGNLTALEAVMADLRQQRPDIIFQGGDVATAGCNPAEVIDLIADAGWSGVLGSLPSPYPLARKRASGTDWVKLCRAFGALCMGSPGERGRIWHATNSVDRPCCSASRANLSRAFGALAIG
jgi:3',5'-cyclic AMP phosphodiesterase CpdA